MIRNRHFSHLVALNNTKVLIGAQLAYTAAADFPTFVEDGVVGTIGVFLEAKPNTLVPGNATVATGTELFIATKRRQGAKAIQTIRTKPFKVANLKRIVRTAYVAPVLQVSKIAIPASPVIGTTYTIWAMDATPGGEPFSQYSWSFTPTVATTQAALITALVSRINTKSNFENKNNDQIVVASSTDTNSTLTLTAKEAGIKFELQGRDGLLNQVVTDVAAPVLGSGSSDQVRAIEAQGLIGDGIVTNYPMNGVPSEYGLPDSQVVSTGTYNLYQFEQTPQTRVQGPLGSQAFDQKILLVIPSNGAANPEAAIKLIFGL